MISRGKEKLPEPSLLGSRLVFVTAHPDDESYAFGGLLIRNAEAGGENYLVCLTDGERGNAHLKRPISEKALRRLRAGELSAAARVLKIRSIIRCRLPDGRVSEHRTAAVNRAAGVVKKLRGDAVVSFGPDGITGHRDHLQAGRIAVAVARRRHLPILRGVLPAPARSDLIVWLGARRGSRHYARSVRTAVPRYRAIFSLRAKRRALWCHRSQMDGPKRYTGYAPFAVKALSRHEYYI